MKTVISLIAELDELTQSGLEYLKNNYIGIPLSEKLANKLKSNKDYENYITATVLRNKDMIIDDSIPIIYYRHVYCNVPQMFDIMSSHWDFLEAMQKKEHLDEIGKEEDYKKLIEPMFKIPQHSEFFEWLLNSQFSEEEKKKYLDTLGKFASAKDSKRIQEIICQNKNMNLMDDKSRYYHIWERFWDPSHKAQYTRKWNEHWSKKFGHM